MQSNKTKNIGKAKIPAYKKTWSELSEKQKARRENSLSVIKEARRRKTTSLSEIAKEHKTSVRVVQNNTNALRKTNDRWQVKKRDRIHRSMIINENGKPVSIEINDSRTASIIGRYQNAIKQLVTQGKTTQLSKLSKKKVRDSKGNLHSLETNPEAILKIQERIESEPDRPEVYSL